MSSHPSKKSQTNVLGDSSALPKVVAIDDEKSVLEFYTAILEDICDIHGFLDPEEGLYYIFHNDISLAILDRKLPHIAGDDICSRLRSNTRTKNLPIIIISGINEIEDIAEMMSKQQIDTYLTKPVSPERLRNQVKFYLTGCNPPKHASQNMPKVT